MDPHSNPQQSTEVVLMAGEIGGINFSEVLGDEVADTRPTSVAVYVVRVEPRMCGPLIKRLSATPLGDLSHLKRVKSVPQQVEPEDDNAPKRKRFDHSRDVLIGSVSSIGPQWNGVSGPLDLTPSVAGTPMDFLRIVQVPARQADSKAEWQDFNSIWPMTYFPNKQKEFLDQQQQLTTAELEQMTFGMREAIKDAHALQSEYGAIILSPESGVVVAVSSKEREVQDTALPSKAAFNPLSTSVLLAIQGVSRLEREAAVAIGRMDRDEFQSGQYLCTGYDVYTTLEPTIFEAMALVHSRIRRLVFGCQLTQNKTLPGGIFGTKVHALPGTNHHYRAFVCQSNNDFGELCKRLQTHNP